MSIQEGMYFLERPHGGKGVLLGGVPGVKPAKVFVIGGGVSKAGQFLIDVIDKYYKKMTPISDKKSAIGLAKLGNDAGIYGAARLVLV